MFVGCAGVVGGVGEIGGAAVERAGVGYWAAERCEEIVRRERGNGEEKVAVRDE